MLVHSVRRVYGELLFRQAKQHATLLTPFRYVIDFKRALGFGVAEHDFVFCRDCEQLLSRNGENWVIRQLADEDGFPLLANLHSAPAAMIDDDMKVYACDPVSGFDCDKLAHFGMGIFWKGHAHQWPNCDRLHLGNYGEPLRKHLRGEVPVPDHAALFIRV